MLPQNRPPSHPGEILSEEFLKPMGITQTRLAEHLKCSHAKVNELVRGKRGITPAVALSLADVFGTTPNLWMNLQNQFDLWHAQRTHEKKQVLAKAI